MFLSQRQNRILAKTAFLYLSLRESFWDRTNLSSALCPRSMAIGSPGWLGNAARTARARLQLVIDGDIG
jgi:hypothetical protein